MNSISIDISGRIDPERIAVLRGIKDVADELGIRFFVVGAFARDVIFEHIHRIPAPRITEDIDIGVEVASWEEFHRLTGTMSERDLLDPTTLPYRFSARRFPAVVDIVPYGVISGQTKSISWPPDHQRVMSLLGFEEACQSALRVQFSTEPPLGILVPSVPALAIMKIISWNDAYPSRDRDASDLLFILESYGSTDVLSKLYEFHIPLLTEEEFDPRFASVRLLGREIALLGRVETVRTIEEILERETDEDRSLRMLADMVRGVSFRSDNIQAALQLLKKLLQGIKEERSRDCP
ncbi:MAG: nucleotidyl transferase AbiEii/AbiGii toxin family protein [Chlorobium sp.]|uniref:nucleotidyl transferase AbiEii/AbiGii toxin family protein n=1 Tax=Chlorobium sp. TaxID=1095 RepID=UPI0025B981B0|nr:nucleotidyl transferase AbiEii/AbiGii toxin family protein [Chlorobium sp.]MCF8382173.1 nucleotidyl transferase AbiEii/AbiGii toxin family protein [Chlorobium sp.]